MNGLSKNSGGIPMSKVKKPNREVKETRTTVQRSWESTQKLQGAGLKTGKRLRKNDLPTRIANEASRDDGGPPAP